MDGETKDEKKPDNGNRVEPIVRLENLSDRVRRGEAIDFMDALEVIDYQGTLREKRKNSIWERFKHWLTY